MRLSTITICFLILCCISCKNLMQTVTDSKVKKLSKKNVSLSYLDFNSTRIKYLKGGKGPNLLFIHGFGADAMYTWDACMERYCDSFSVIAPDLCWFGESYSDKPSNLETQAENILILLDSLGIKDTKIVCQSYGGFVAFELIRQRKDICNELIVVDSPGMILDPRFIDTACVTHDIDSIHDLFVFDHYTGVNKLVEVGFYKNKKLPKGLAKKSYEYFFTKNHEQLKSLTRTLPSSKITFDTIPGSFFPKSHVIWGVEDELFPLYLGRNLSNYLNCELIEIPKAGHASHMDNPKLFYKALDSLLY
jgi:pimeloyl-ACP methyl ester carboxylesterase